MGDDLSSLVQIFNRQHLVSFFLGYDQMSGLVSTLQDPFFVTDGGRPLYFRNGAVDDLDAAQDEVLWMHLFIEALTDARSHVEEFSNVISRLVENLDATMADELRQRSRLLETTRDNFTGMLTACDQWLHDFARIDPMPRLQVLAKVGSNIVRAHVAMCTGELDRETLIRYIRGTKERAALNGALEIQVRSLLCDAPDECKDVDFCERLLDWHVCF